MFAGQMSTTITAFGVMIAMANFLPKEVLGDYRYVLSWIALLALSSLPGMGTAMTQSTSKGFYGQLSSAVTLRVKWSALGVIAAVLIGFFYLFVGNTAYALLFFISAPFLLIYNSFFTYYFYLQGREEFDKAAQLQIISRVFFFMAMIFATIFFPTALVLIMVFLSVTILGQFIGYLYTNKKDKKQGDNKDTELNSYATFMTALHIPTFLSSNLDKVFVGMFLGPVQLAVYYVAITLAFETGRIGRMLGQLFLPKFSRSESIETWNILKKIFFLEILLLIAWGAYALAAPYIFALLFPDYPEAVILSIYAMAIILATPVYIIRTLLIARKEKKILRNLLVFIPLVQTFVLLTALIFFGLNGAVFGLVSGAMIELIVTLTILVFVKKL